MARNAEFYTTVGDGPKAQTVGYSSTRRGIHYGVRFTGPDGNRIEKTTKATKKDGDYHTEAARFIARAFAATYNTPAKAHAITWDEAMKEVDAATSDLRQATRNSYHRGIKQLRETFQQDDKTPRKPTGPSEITQELANRFSTKFFSTPYTRSKKEGAKKRKRQAGTLSYYLRALSALWRIFRDLGYVTSNPWSNIRKREQEKKPPHVPTEQEITHFMTWVKTRYPDWERLELLLRVKMLSGCRSSDVCQLESSQLKDKSLVFSPGQTKTKTGRKVPLGDDLFNRLKKAAGKVYLWEGFLDDIKLYRVSKNKLPDSFQPSTVFWVLSNLFREYNEAHADRPRLTPHALRRRAITIMVVETQNVDLTAQAIDVSPLTARKHYLDAQRAFNTDEAFKLASEKLDPK
jgi:integrase